MPKSAARGTGTALYRPNKGCVSSELTEREIEVAVMVGEGFTNAQIAARLSRSESTVRNHIFSIFMRLQVHSRVELARYLIREGLLEP